MWYRVQWRASRAPSKMTLKCRGTRPDILAALLHRLICKYRERETATHEGGLHRRSQMLNWKKRHILWRYDLLARYVFPEKTCFPTCLGQCRRTRCQGFHGFRLTYRRNAQAVSGIRAVVPDMQLCSPSFTNTPNCLKSRGSYVPPPAVMRTLNGSVCKIDFRR